jgi:hypothetical protein
MVPIRASERHKVLLAYTTGTVQCKVSGDRKLPDIFTMLVSENVINSSKESFLTQILAYRVISSRFS